VPGNPSKWAGLYSKVTQVEPTTVRVPSDGALIGSQATNPAITASTVGQLKRVRSLSLADLDALLRRKGTPDDNIEFIRGLLEPPSRFAELRFDIYEDPQTGATLGVPSTVELTWNRDLRVLEARTGSGAVRMFIGVLPSASYAQARRDGKAAFVGRIVGLANWKESPATMEFVHVDESIEWANNAGFFGGTDRATGQPVSLLLSLSVSGQQLLGYAVYGPEKIETLPDADLIAYLMMQMAAQELSGFAET
jgi:hypothetical protein